MINLVIGTWTFSQKAIEIALNSLQQDYSALDSIEKGINVLERDENYGPCFVGRGGARNSSGYLEMDAAVMDGKSLKFGAVTALQGVDCAISVARCLMEKSPHSMLTADGARTFAKDHGFKIDQSLLIPKYNNIVQSTPGHDTLGLVAVDSSGNVCAGITTSGTPNKHPGRVGDSPLPGCGLYADDESGGACCTGDGDHILRFCPSFKVTQLMKQGNSPQTACDHVVQEVVRRSEEDYFEIGIIAAATTGEYGAASTVKNWQDPLTGKEYGGFPYVVWTDGMESPSIKMAPTFSRKE